MFTHTLDPTILTLGPLEIRWYGLMYVLAFLAVDWFAKRAIRQGKLKLTEKELDYFLGLLIFAMIFGARLFYTIFYNPSYFIAEPWKFFFIWEGGLSFHGGFVGMLITALIYCKKKNISFLSLADIFIIPLALGNAFGRIGNFINGELYGVPTDLPWGVLFQGVAEPRHPTQLYEAGYNLIIFAILLVCSKKNWKPGKLFGLFMILYSVSRFAVEFLKDLPVYGPLTMGQWLTIPLFLVGVYLVARRNP